MTHSDRVHPAGAHLYVIISPDADDAESSVDAAVVEVLDELGVAASRSGGSIGRGSDVAVVDVLLNVGTSFCSCTAASRWWSMLLVSSGG